MPAIEKICIIRLSSLGDIILSFTLIKKLRKKFPQAEVHYVTKSAYKNVPLLIHGIDKVLVMKDSVTDLRKQIGKEKYDLIIDIHKNIRSRMLKWFNSGRVVTYKKNSIKRFLLVKFKINLFREVIPVWKKYLLCAKEFLDEDDFEFEPGELIIDDKKIIAGEYIVIAPSARHFTKTYPAEKFIEAINKYRSANQERIVLTGDNSDTDMRRCREIELKCSGIINLCGKLEVAGLANVLLNSKNIICNDSAVLHLAEAAGKDVTAIFGSTVKEFGFFPQLKDSQVLEIKDLKCRPCSHVGRESCPLGHFKCMKEIELAI